MGLLGSFYLKRAMVVVALFVFIQTLPALTYQYTPLNNEPAYKIDIPGNWIKKEISGNNGKVVVFYPADNPAVVIEIRSFVLEKEESIKSIINKKAARLSYYYPSLELGYERFSILRPGVYETRWILENKKGRFVEKSVLLKNNNEVIIAGVSAPEKIYGNYNVLFENALFSVDYSDDSRKSENKKSIDNKRSSPFFSLGESLRNLYLFNFPNKYDLSLDDKNNLIREIQEK